MAERIRVAQVVTRFIAGAGGVALRGGRALDPDRYQITVLAADGGSLLAEAERSGFKVVRLRHMVPELDPRADARALREVVDRLGAGAFQVVHTHSAKAGALGRWAARRVGVPAIVHTFHGFPFHDYQSTFRRRGYIEVERRLGRITSRFLAVGAAVAADAIRLGIAPCDRIRVIAAAVGGGLPPTTPASRARARRLLGLPLDVPVIGTVGRLDYQKAPGDMLAALTQLGRPDVRLVWVGDGPLRAKTERAIAAHGLGDRFRLLGERQDVPAILPAFDVFAMSSLYEGLPCAVVEAMTCGIPVVATAVNAVPEIVVPGRTGLLARPHDPASVARGMAWLLDHPEEAVRMAGAGKEQLGDRFGSEALGRDLQETYALALEGAR
jgi:glycosyltransferase involved in cell wall biosynthesis